MAGETPWLPSEHSWSHKHWGREAASPAPLGSWNGRGEMPMNPPGVGWAGQLGMEEGDRNDVDEPHMILCEMLCSPAVEGS